MERFFSGIIILAVVLSCTGVEPAVEDISEDKTVSDEPPEIMLAVTIDYGFFDRWYRSVSDDIPSIIQCESLVPEQKFNILVFAADYEMENKHVSLNYDLRVTAPDNTVYVNKTGLTLMDRDTDDVYLLLADDIITGSFELSDLYGEYEIRVTVYDNIKKLSAAVSKKIEFAESKEGADFSSYDSYTAWMHGYYDNPEPERSLKGIRFFAEKYSATDENIFEEASGFYSEIISSNLYLIEDVAEEFGSYNMQTKLFLINLFYRMNNEKAELFLEGLDENDREIYDSIIMFSRDTDQSMDLNYVNYLWGGFFASAKYEYILSLVNCTDPAITDLKLSEAALQSVYDNSMKYSLVKSYCRYIYMYEDVSQTVRDNLEVILDS